MEEHTYRVGPGCPYATVSEALSAADSHAGHAIVELTSGVYREKLSIDRPWTTLRGVGEDRPVIVFGDCASTIRKGRPLGTFESATVTVSSHHFSAEHLVLANDFDYPGHRQLVAENPGKIKGLQAVAFRTTGSADCTVMTDCRFHGYQDTLLLDAGFHRLESCTVEGNIDFIFGGGSALFRRCSIVSNGAGYICAPSTKSDALGFFFQGCRFLRTEGVADHSVWLGRPWHPGADPFITSYAGLLSCFLDSHIKAEGWTWMHGFVPAGGEEIFTPSQSKFFEADSTGSGAFGPGPDRSLVDRGTAERELERLVTSGCR